MVVLVVDDDPNAAELVGALLEFQGHAAFTARSPEQALHMAEQVHPDVAFLDIGLPRMDGFALADAMGRLPGMDECRFFAITGFDDIGDRQKTVASRFEERLLKPVALETLNRVMRTVAG